ncbi:MULTISPECIES: hypothetical protein [unclassified Synechocystis]|uniref:hypothetical protein n=1 Tax=unclassified Synechocystis TaxID=2640012 RepID=UPI00040A47BE|nr:MULTISPECIES: hypothetical protein [unclassified Synechocystis]AIE74594.1 hypothetical protein D082_20660 [Synechocystis sp. PCC 6714]MCT0254042.1 hypothetical protein [Synechocystis sp. CS-94]
MGELNIFLSRVNLTLGPVGYSHHLLCHAVTGVLATIASRQGLNKQGLFEWHKYGQLAGKIRRYSQGHPQGTTAHRTDGGNR